MSPVPIGERFGHWLVLGRHHISAYWLCRCACGVEKGVNSTNLKSGMSKSCGCLGSRSRAGDRTRTHGRSGTTEHAILNCIRQRCLNPKNPAYPRYGGRGITICDRWRDSFEAFYADMGPRPSPKHSIDRIDNDLGYAPENCRWATDNEQAANQRTNRLLTHAGQTHHLSEWARITGLKRETISVRIRKYGWSVERALTTPLQHSR